MKCAKSCGNWTKNKMKWFELFVLALVVLLLGSVGLALSILRGVVLFEWLTN